MAESFEDHRSYLFALAYRMLGSAMDAEDMVQETYLRFQATSPETRDSIVSLKAWDALPADLKAIVAHACAAEAGYALAEMERLNAQALAALIADHGVKLTAFPDDVIAAARKEADGVLGELAARDAISGRVHASYADFRGRVAQWSRVSIEAVLRGRG